MFKDPVEAGCEVPTTKPGKSAIHVVVGPRTLSDDSWRGYGIFLKITVREEVAIDLAWVEDVRLRLSTTNDTAPENGSVDLHCVC